MSGVTMSLTIAATTAPNAAPMTTATARSTRLPRRMNSRKSLITRGCLAPGADGAPLHHARREATAERPATAVGEAEARLHLVRAGRVLSHLPEPQLRAPEHLERAVGSDRPPRQVDEPLPGAAVHVRAEEVGPAVAPRPNVDLELEQRLGR